MCIIINNMRVLSPSPNRLYLILFLYGANILMWISVLVLYVYIHLGYISLLCPVLQIVRVIFSAE